MIEHRYGPRRRTGRNWPVCFQEIRRTKIDPWTRNGIITVRTGEGLVRNISLEPFIYEKGKGGGHAIKKKVSTGGEILFLIICLHAKCSLESLLKDAAI